MMIGSMSPDFAYFLPAGLNRASTHDLDGVFLFCLPVGLALWLLFTRLIERPTLELLPAAWRERAPRSDTTLSPRVLVFAALAVVIGALTHVAWDAFTHGDTPITNAFPVFDIELFAFHGQPFRVYRALQYLSSVLGLLALARWGWNLRHAPAPKRQSLERSSLSDRARIVALLAIVMASGMSALFGYVSNLHSPFDARMFHLLVGGMTGCALAWMAVSLWVVARARFRR